MNETLPERFAAKYVVDPESGCWVWRASTCKGYGQIYFDGRPRGAHRAAYILHVGPIPEGSQIDHLCRNPLCVNPDHLEVVTPRENTLRGESPSARQARQSHCLRGHALEGDNLYVPPKQPNKRHCRTCMAIRRDLNREAVRRSSRESKRRQRAEALRVAA